MGAHTLIVISLLEFTQLPSFLLLFPRIISLQHLLLRNISFLRATRAIVCLMNRLAVEYNAIQKSRISFRLDYYHSVVFVAQYSIENIHGKLDILAIKSHRFKFY